jgi:hypothetical protein
MAPLLNRLCKTILLESTPFLDIKAEAFENNILTIATNQDPNLGEQVNNKGPSNPVIGCVKVNLNPLPCLLFHSMLSHIVRENATMKHPCQILLCFGLMIQVVTF